MPSNLPGCFRRFLSSKPLVSGILIFLFLAGSIFLFQHLTRSIAKGQGTLDTPLLGKIPTQVMIDQIALAPDSGVAYGINKLWKSLYVFDRANYQVKKKIQLDKRPVGIAVHPQTNLAYIVAKPLLPLPNKNGALYVITPEGQTINSLSIPKNSQGIAINPANNTAVITSEDDQKLIIISTDTLATLKEIPLLYRPRLVALDLDSAKAVVTAKEHWWSILSNRLLVVDLNSGSVLNDQRFTDGIRGIAVDSEKDEAVVVTANSINSLDITQGTIISTIQSPISFPFWGSNPGDDLDDYAGVAINPSTHMGIISGNGGFLLLNLNDNTHSVYQTDNCRGMKAVAMDSFRNTFLASFWNGLFLFPSGKGVMDIQLPNPVPEITSLNPPQTMRGSGALTITIEGSKFIKSSAVNFGSQPLTTTFKDNQHLEVNVAGEMFAAGGIFSVTVVNPIPRGGPSNTVTFIVNNPVPTITALDPASAIAGTQNLTVAIHGSGFFPDTTLTINGQAKPCTFIDNTQLQVIFGPTDLGTAGSLEIIASNPAPGGGASNPMTFTVLNPAPALNSLSQNSVKAGSPGFTFTLTGSNFVPASSVLFNNTTAQATFIDSNHITVAIPSEAIKIDGTSGSVSFTVTKASNVNPLPDGSYGKTYEDLIPADATIPSYDPKRFSIVTGLVKDLSGSPLAGVIVSIHSRPEYGTVQTDTAGRFSLPTNGGGTITLIYRKAGLIESHRQVNLGWNTIANAETIVMIPEDQAATSLTFDGNPATILTHKSTTTNDSFGSRSLAMIFTGDNIAYVKDAQGNEQPLTNITVRATEYPTPESMPAKLPPTSAFTYCAELAVDGAKSVRFEKPVVVFVDNFLGFPVGEVVPVGYYDRDQAVWIPSDNGVVVTLLDTNGDGIVDAYDSVGDGQSHGINWGQVYFLDIEEIDCMGYLWLVLYV